MPPNENTNAEAEEVEAVEESQEETTPDTQEVEEQAETEVAASETEEASENPEEEFDIEQYAKERYQAPPQSETKDLASEVAEELSNLPADDDGNVDQQAVAKWFADKINQAGSQAEQRAVQAAQNTILSELQESKQQTQLLSKYPELSKDKEFIEDVFDKRDAAALRGENLSLLDAAERIARRTQAAKSEAAQKATRVTTTQAAAHLETSAVKGSNPDQKQQLAAQAFHGTGQASKEARHELLKQHVLNEMKEGRIETPN